MPFFYYARVISSLVLLAALALLTACSGKTEAKYPTGHDRTTTGGDIYGKKESVFGAEGLKILGDKDKKDDGSSGIGVNSFLWRASLDTVSFMPLASADPFGGVILTDWYTPPENPDERFKLNVFILGKYLRSDGVSVKVFRQEKSGNMWKDAVVDEKTGRQLEDAILTRARQMRVAQISEEE